MSNEQSQLQALIARRLGEDPQGDMTSRLVQRRLEQGEFQALLEKSELAGLADAGKAMGFDQGNSDETLFTDIMDGSLNSLSLKALAMVAEMREQEARQGMAQDTEPLASEVRAQVDMRPQTPEVLAQGRVEHALMSSIRGPLNKEVLASPTLDIIAEALVAKPEAQLADTCGVEKLNTLRFGMEPVHGALSARFESGADGIAAIGFDDRGGTSYGKYQIASRTGTMRMFLSFLDKEEPEWSARLRAAGPSDTGSRYGMMPTEWKKIAEENPVRFENLQDTFIRNTLYRPALQSVLEATGINIGECSTVLQEVLWSTSVQHGASGASSIFASAIRGLDESSQNFDRDLITKVYNVRKQHFQSASSTIRQTVKARLTREMNLALSLLNGTSARVI